VLIHSINDSCSSFGFSCDGEESNEGVQKQSNLLLKKQSHRQFCGPISDWLACGIVLAGDFRAWSVLDSNGGAIYIFQLF